MTLHELHTSLNFREVAEATKISGEISKENFYMKKVCTGNFDYTEKF